MKNLIYSLHKRYQNLGSNLNYFDGIASLALRLYLIPIFWMAGHNKLQHFNDTVEWFGKSECG